jgi:hypothetical protein
MKPKNKNLSQPSLTLIICDPRYEMKIISQKKNRTNHKVQGPLSQCQMMKTKKKINI